MWSIDDLKSRARDLLTRTYWKSFAVCLVVDLLVLAVTSVFQKLVAGIAKLVLGVPFGFSLRRAFANSSFPFDSYSVSIVMTVILVVFLLILDAALTSFFTQPVATGQNRFFMRTREGLGTYNDALFSFNGPHYLSVVKTLFLQSLYLTLWSLLLVIPGIIKTYEYYMIPYILAENPSLDGRRVFEISRGMTDNEKMNIFVFELSFIGWYLLAALACGLGLFFLNPYVEASRAELYAALRDKALYTGIASAEELPGFHC